MTNVLRNSFISTAILVAVFAYAGFASAATINVPADHLTIQAAVDAAVDTDVIEIADGTYVEQVVVTKSITLNGTNGSANVIVQAPGVMADPFGYGANIITVKGSGVAAEIAGLTITGPGPSACGSIRAGIFVGDSADANIHDNNIVDIRDDPAGGCQNGQGIYVGRKFLSTTGTATITNNTISGYQKGGIVVDNAGSSASITGNVVTGLGSVAFIAQNGIQISRGATGTVSGNTVTGNDYTPAGDVSTGILLFTPDASVVVGPNSVSNNEIGLWTNVEGTIANLDISGVSANGRDSVADTLGGFPGDPLNEYFAWATSTNVVVDQAFSPYVNDADGKDIFDDAGTLRVIGFDAFTTIQSGIDGVCDCGTVTVRAGTYTENLDVNQSVTINGANAGTPADGTRGAETNLMDSYIRVNADDVTVDGFTITNGASVPAGDPSGVYVVGGYSSTTVMNNVFTRTGGSNGFRGVINEFGGTTNIAVTENSFSGWATGVYLQNASGQVANNTFDANVVGVSNDGANGVSIDNNSFMNNTFESIGVGPGTLPTDITIMNNDFQNNATLVGSYVADNIDAAYNWFGGATQAEIETEMTENSTGAINFSPWYTDQAKTQLQYATTLSGTTTTASTGTTPNNSTTTTGSGIVIEMNIPANTTVEGNASWDGIINPPAQTTDATNIPSAGGTILVNNIESFEIGSSQSSLTFSPNAVQLVFKGQAGKQVGFNTPGGFIEIVTVCADNTATTNNNLPAGGDCKIDVGSDLVVWTKHLTVFSLFTTTSNASTPGTGGGGGGGGTVVGLIGTTNSGGGGGGGGTNTVPVTQTNTNTNTGGQVLGAATYNFATNLRLGSRGADVTALQQVLIAEGHLSISAPTGYFGPLTLAAVKKYQAAHGISPQSGFVGPLTRAELNKGTSP